MKRLVIICSLSGLAIALIACAERRNAEEVRDMAYPVQKSEDEWRQELTEEEYKVLRKKGTEKPFAGKWHAHEGAGLYQCAACGNPVFSSEAKFKSGTGWPSYWAPISEGNIDTREDNTLFMRRTEVVCGRCGSHLGHVFNDGPKPTGLRYCINSVALDFEAKEEAGDTGE